MYSSFSIPLTNYAIVSHVRMFVQTHEHMYVFKANDQVAERTDEEGGGGTQQQKEGNQSANLSN